MMYEKERQPQGGALDEQAIQTFQKTLRGAAVRPGDAAYEDARAVWNGMIDKRPALVVRCANAGDVAKAVNFARDHHLLLAVRGSGHNVAGLATCDGGLVVDLSALNGVQVDADARFVRAGGGARWCDVDAATQPFGLATPGGVVSDTGIAGLTLVGGYGWLSHKFGLSCDNVIAVDIVTADGRQLRASENENADLFWGIRGGGGNFGIVTAFEYRLHEVGPEVMFCFVFHHGDRAVEALRFFREYTSKAPDEVSIIAVYGTIPPVAEAFPKEIHGTPFLAFVGAYAGPASQGERVLQPLRDFSKPLIDFSGRMAFVEAQKILDKDYPAHELRYYWKSLHLRELSDEVIERLVDHARRQPSPFSTTDVWHLGGAVQRVSEEAMAFSGRNVPFLLNAEANWPDPKDDKANVTWVREFVDAMQVYSDGGRYLNFGGFLEEGEKAMRATFGAKYDRLVALKNKYDPDNLFRLNQNVRPSGR